jgi:O-antigen ligase
MTERLTFNTGTRSTAAPASPSVPVAADDPIEVLAAEEPKRRDWAFELLLWFTALVFLRPQDTFPPLQYLHLAELCAIAALGALIGGRLGRNLPVTRLTPELIGVVALGGVILLTAPFSIWFGGAVGTFKEIYSKIILIYLLMVNVLTTPRRIERINWLLVLASGYLAFRAVLDYVRGNHLVENGRVEGSVGGIFKNPNDLALNMVAMLPLAIFIALRPGPPLRRATAAGCAVLMLGAIVASHSRAGTLGLATMLCVLAILLIRRHPGLVIGGVIVVSLAAPMLPSSYWHRIASITDSSLDETGSREARRQLFHESLQAFLENPITGVGAGEFKNWNPDGRQQPWRESHDVLLQVAAELGILGLALFLFLIARAFMCVRESRRLLRRAAPKPRRARPDGSGRTPVPEIRLAPSEYEFLEAHTAAMFAAVAGWFVCALFASVAYNWTFYYLLALAAAPRDLLLARRDVARATSRARRATATSRLEVARA